MSRNVRSTSLILGALLVLGLAPALLADDDHGCSYRSVAGNWGYRYTGTVLPSDPVGAVGIFTLDKNGNVSDGKLTENDAGFITHATFSGTFTVNADCTGSIAVTLFVDGNPIGDGEFDIVWIDNSNDVRMVLIADNEVLTLDGKKLFPKGD
jgi:hypothetical protein